MKKSLLLAFVAALGIMPMAGQTANKALSFTPGATVNCGPVQGLDAATSYTFQLWVKPAAWNENAVLLSRGEDFSIKFGSTVGSLKVNAGGREVTAASDNLKLNEWAQITVVCNEGAATVLVDGVNAGTGQLGAIPSARVSVLLGGEGFNGCLDEVRLWACAVPATYNYFINTTVDRFNPNWAELAAYYRMDYANLDALVDYKSIETPSATYNNHGIIAEGITRVDANNAKMPYLINSAYTANERFFDRAIPADQYLLSNDLVILGVESLSDGHVRVINPNNHASVSGGVTFVASDGARTGVASFDGTGTLTVNSNRCYDWTATGNKYAGATFETWVKVDEWTNGAFLIQKETTSSWNRKGFSVRLGSTAGQIIVRVDGKDWTFNTGKSTGTWFHLGVSQEYTDAGNVRNLSGLLLAVDGVKVSPTSTQSTYTPTLTNITATVIGSGFKGMLDNTAMWSMSFNEAGFHKGTMPMPGIGVKIEAAMMLKANTLFNYDDADNLGYDSYSQDHWRDIMMAAYEGYEGVKVRISVKSHNNWQTTISNASKRENFAKDLGEIAKGYDGVELDLEWMDGQQTSLGALAEQIRNYLPAGKTLHISIHSYGAFCFPLDKMQYVDGFTFQQYGEQYRYFPYDTNDDNKQYSYLGSLQALRDYGFDMTKVMPSFATTTSVGYEGEERMTAVNGIRNIIASNPNLDPNANSVVMPDGYTYSFTGPMQAYQRAAYVVEQGMQGIFYWDMGNDMQDVMHPWNIARSASYGLNPAIARRVDSVTPNHANPRTVIGYGDITPDLFKFADKAVGTTVPIVGTQQDGPNNFRPTSTTGAFIEYVENNGPANTAVIAELNGDKACKLNVNNSFGYIYFYPDAPQDITPLRGTITFALTGMNRSTGKHMEVGVVANNTRLAPVYEKLNQELTNGEWITVELPATDNAQGFYFRCEQLNNIDATMWFKEIKFETLVEMERFDMTLRGSFNGWSATANGAYFDDVVDNCAKFVVENWHNGDDGFKFVVSDGGNDVYYGKPDNNTLNNGQWYDFSTSGNNAKLDAAAEGKNVTFTFTTDRHSVKAEWDPTVKVLGDFNTWNQNDSQYTVTNLTDGVAVFEIAEWPSDDCGFKYQIDGQWYSFGGELNYGETYTVTGNENANMTLKYGTVLSNVVITINPIEKTIMAVWKQKATELAETPAFNYYDPDKYETSVWAWNADIQNGSPAAFDIVNYMFNNQQFNYEDKDGYAVILNNNYNMAGIHADCSIEQLAVNHQALKISPTNSAGFGYMFFAPALAAYLDNVRVKMQIRIVNTKSAGAAFTYSGSDGNFEIMTVNHNGVSSANRIVVDLNYMVQHENITAADGYDKWLELTFDATDAYALRIAHHRLLQYGAAIYIRAISFESIENTTLTGNYTVNATNMTNTPSDMARWITVEPVKQTTGIDEVAQEAVEGAVNVFGNDVEFTAAATVYTTSGTLVANVAAGQHINLASGLYIARFADNAVKFAVR